MSCSSLIRLPPARVLSSVVFACVATGALTEVEADTDHNAAVWLSLNTQTNLGRANPRLDKLTLWFDAHARFFDDPVDSRTTIARPGLGYSLTENGTLWLGYAWIREFADGSRDFDEHRIWQQFMWSTEFEPLKFMSRSRLEQRFVETGSDTGWRLRQFFKLEHPFAFQPRFSVVSTDELFFDLNSTDWGARSGFAQNRLFAGLGWKFDAEGHVKLEAGYLNQFISRDSAPNTMNHIAALNLFLDF